MRFFRPKNSESGQILLIVVLAAVISLTVGLSVASRVITNTKTTTDEINSQKALSAAETGVEQSLKTNTSVMSTSFQNNSAVNATTTPVITSQFLINGGNLVNQDDSADIWLSDHGIGTKPTYNNPRTMDLKIYWTDNTNDPNSCSQNAAIEVVVISGTPASPVVSRYAYDPCSRPNGSNGFTDPVLTGGLPISTISFQHSALIHITSGLIARVIPLYASTKLAAEMYNSNTNTGYNGNGGPPSQGYLIQSTGTAANVTRTLRVFQGYPKLPTEFFPYTLFIPTSK